MIPRWVRGERGGGLGGISEGPDIRKPGPGYSQQMTHPWMTGDGGGG